MCDLLRPLVHTLCNYVDLLLCQVINAALTLAARPQSKVAQDNMDVFKDQWEKQVRILTEAVDDITSVDDFLSVSGMWQYSTNCFADCLIEEYDPLVSFFYSQSKIYFVTVSFNIKLKAHLCGGFM